jgi:hypothetical protein
MKKSKTRLLVAASTTPSQSKCIGHAQQETDNMTYFHQHETKIREHPLEDEEFIITVTVHHSLTGHESSVSLASTSDAWNTPGPKPTDAAKTTVLAIRALNSALDELLAKLEVQGG